MTAEETKLLQETKVIIPKRVAQGIYCDLADVLPPQKLTEVTALINLWLKPEVRR